MGAKRRLHRLLKDAREEFRGLKPARMTMVEVLVGTTKVVPSRMCVGVTSQRPSSSVPETCPKNPALRN
jgi:hypothetical protein